MLIFPLFNKNKLYICDALNIYIYSPTLCQKFVNAALKDTRIKYEQVYMIHYMDDILIAHPDRTYLQTVLQDLTQALTDRGLKIAPEKIRINPPITYLERVINSEQ